VAVHNDFEAAGGFEIKYLKANLRRHIGVSKPSGINTKPVRACSQKLSTRQIAYWSVPMFIYRAMQPERLGLQ
jgi:hypothetical protein